VFFLLKDECIDAPYLEPHAFMLLLCRENAACYAPVNGPSARTDEVDTGIEVDPDSFKEPLPRAARLSGMSRSPAEIKAWLSGNTLREPTT
jgi:hypothetical protein